MYMPYFISEVTDQINGDLWMATYDEGVWKYDGASFIPYSIEDGEKMCCSTPSTRMIMVHYGLGHKMQVYINTKANDLESLFLNINRSSKNPKLI